LVFKDVTESVVFSHKQSSHSLKLQVLVGSRVRYSKEISLVSESQHWEVKLGCVQRQQSLSVQNQLSVNSGS
jgi:hypothetical protein